MTLTHEQVEAIRREARTPGNSYAAVAVKWGVDRDHVAYIAKRQRTNAKGDWLDVLYSPHEESAARKV